MHEHDGYAPHSHEVRADHLGVNRDSSQAGRLSLEELEHAARDAIVIIAGLVDGARKHTWYTDTDAGGYLDKIDQATVRLASVLPENREV